MGKSPEQLRADIERTRMELDRDLEALADKVSPRQMVNRRVERARTVVRDVKDQVMGTASDKAQDIAETAQQTPQAVQRKARGNPIAAGMIAFGAGWAISSLIPPTKAERTAARVIEDKAREPVQGLKEEVKHAAHDIKETMREPVSDAASEVSGTTREAAKEVSQEAREQRTR